MAQRQAVKEALGLFHLPTNLRRLRSEPLPPDVDVLLRIVAGDSDLLATSSVLSERSPDLIRQAAVFYIEQVLFSPDADHYRLLAAPSTASVSDLRRNMALLMSWLHPDKDISGERAHLAARVTTAWDTLRSAERRADYDAALQVRHMSSKRSSRNHSGRKGPSEASSNKGGKSQMNGPARLSTTSTRLPKHPGLLSRGLFYLQRLLRDRSLP